MDEEISIPTYIDEPSHVLIWQWDEMLPVCVGLIVGLWLGSPMFGLMGGVMLKRGYVKIRDDKPRGFYFHQIREAGLMNAPKGKHSMPVALVSKYIL